MYYFPHNDLVIKCSDKYAIRDHIEKKDYDGKLVQLLGTWENPADINFDELPEKFVLKCSHGCACNIVCSDKSNFDKKTASSK